MKFDDIYKPPFHDMFGAWVETEEGVRCFDWELRMDIKTRQTIIDIILRIVYSPLHYYCRISPGRRWL